MLGRQTGVFNSGGSQERSAIVFGRHARSFARLFHATMRSLLLHVCLVEPPAVLCLGASEKGDLSFKHELPPSRVFCGLGGWVLGKLAGVLTAAPLNNIIEAPREK